MINEEDFAGMNSEEQIDNDDNANAMRGAGIDDSAVTPDEQQLPHTASQEEEPPAEQTINTVVDQPRKRKQGNQSGSLDQRSQNGREQLAGDYSVLPSREYKRRSANAINACARAYVIEDQLGQPPVDESDRVSIQVRTDIIDAYAGRVDIRSIWGSTVNLEYIHQLLADVEIDKDKDKEANRAGDRQKASFDGARTKRIQEVKMAIGSFFTSRALVDILYSLMPEGFIRSSDILMTKSGVATKFESSPLLRDKTVRAVCLEITMAYLIQAGLVSNNIKYASHVSYSFAKVTVDDIKRDLLIAELGAKLKDIPKMSLDTDARYRRTTLAEDIAENLRPVGFLFMDTIDMSNVIDDLILGVRVSMGVDLDATMREYGYVPAEWRSDPVVQELASNLVFLNAALSLEAHSAGLSGLKLDPINRRKYSEQALMRMKTSARYRWVGTAEILATYGLHKYTDEKGRLRSGTLYRQAVVQKVAQAVIAVQDVSTVSALTVIPSSDNIERAIVASYANDLDVALCVKTVDSVMSMIASNRAISETQLISIDLPHTRRSLSELAAIVSDKVIIERPGTGEDTIWWFYVTSGPINYDVKAGVHMGSYIATRDPAEAILVSRLTADASPVAVQPQLLPPDAFRSRLQAEMSQIGVSAKNVSRQFLISIGGVNVTAKFRSSDLSSFRTSGHTTVITPHFNKEVIRCMDDIFAFLPEIIEAAALDKEGTSHLRRLVCRDLLRLTQSLSTGYRREIRDVAVHRALMAGQISRDQGDILRAQMTGSAFAAFLDLEAYAFLLAVQGYPTEGITEVMQLNEMRTTCIDFGSDM